MLRPQLADTRIPLSKHCPKCKTRGHIQLVTHGTQGAYGGHIHGAYVRCWNSHPGVCHCGSWFAHNGVDIEAAVDAAIIAWNKEVAIAFPEPAALQELYLELADLDKLLAKITAQIDDGATFTKLSHEERERIIRQERFMGKYSKVLGERIAAFPSSPGADATTTPTT